MSATVYIANLNGGRLLLDVLAALERQTLRAPVVVADNASTDGSAEAVRRAFADVEVLAFARNRGFGAALNAAVRNRPSEHLIFLNNDAVPEPGFVEALVEAAEAGADMVAGVLLQAADPGVIDSAGVVVDATLLAFDYLHGCAVAAADDAPPPLGPTGGAALYRRGAFEAAGGFDERMFAYLEDVDLAIRLRDGGARCRLAPRARSLHRHSATLGSGSAAKNALMGWSRGYLLRRYGVLRRPRRALRALAAEVVICAGQVVVDGNASGASGRVRGWRAAGGLPALPLPAGAVDVSLREALALRARRRPALRSAREPCTSAAAWLRGRPLA